MAKKISKTGKIRAHVESVPGAKADEIVKATKLPAKFVSTILFQRVKRGEFRQQGDGGYTIDPDFVARKRSNDDLPPRIMGLRAEAKAARKSGGVKSVGEIARKLRAARVFETAPSRQQLLVQHARSTYQALLEACDWEAGQRMPQAALKAHGEALALLEAGAQ